MTGDIRHAKRIIALAENNRGRAFSKGEMRGVLLAGTSWPERRIAVIVEEIQMQLGSDHVSAN